MNLTDQEIADLRAKAEAATPGPWECSLKTAFDKPIDAGDVKGPKPADRSWGGAYGRYIATDAAHIAAANPTAILRLLEDRDRMAAEIARLRADAEWRPIDTAPKDGTDILIWKDMATVPVVHIVWYRGKDEWEESGQYCGFCETLEEWEGWWSYTENSVTQSKLEGHSKPTHWRPLPQPPEARS